MFDFAPVGGIVAAVGLFFLVLVGWRFILNLKITLIVLPTI